MYYTYIEIRVFAMHATHTQTNQYTDIGNINGQEHTGTHGSSYVQPPMPFYTYEHAHALQATACTLCPCARVYICTANGKASQLCLGIKTVNKQNYDKKKSAPCDCFVFFFFSSVGCIFHVCTRGPIACCCCSGNVRKRLLKAS